MHNDVRVLLSMSPCDLLTPHVNFRYYHDYMITHYNDILVASNGTGDV